SEVFPGLVGSRVSHSPPGRRRRPPGQRSLHVLHDLHVLHVCFALGQPRIMSAMPIRLVRSLTALAAAVLMFTGAARRAARPILILISLDGWRWDYLDRAQVPNLRKLAADGVRAEALIPSFPS